jgi:hypothetical protein
MSTISAISTITLTIWDELERSIESKSRPILIASLQCWSSQEIPTKSVPVLIEMLTELLAKNPSLESREELNQLKYFTIKRIENIVDAFSDFASFTSTPEKKTAEDLILTDVSNTNLNEMMKELTDNVKCLFCSTEKLDKVFMVQQQQNQDILKAIAGMMNSAAEDRARADHDRARADHDRARADHDRTTADEKFIALMELIIKRP